MTRLDQIAEQWHYAITSCGTVNRGIEKANWATEFGPWLLQIVRVQQEAIDILIAANEKHIDPRCGHCAYALVEARDALARVAAIGEGEG